MDAIPPETEGGRRKGKFLDVNLWGHDADALNGVLHKGDACTAAGELKSRTDDQGRTWHSLDVRGEIYTGLGAVCNYMDAVAEQLARMDAAA